MKNVRDPCSKLVRKNSKSIPNDVLINIFSRLPTKSIVRFSCLSKYWKRMLRHQNFTELFLTKSSARPRLLFNFQANGKIFFYSTPQPHNPDDNSSLIATRYLTFSPEYFSSTSCFPLHGWICLHDRRQDDLWVICNPVTGQSIALPKVEMKSILGSRSYLGYDPIDKQFKVLCMTWWSDEHRILTLGNGKKMLWRIIKCKPHYPRTDTVICINGFLFYQGELNFEDNKMIVCFDVRSENFNFIKLDVSMSQYSHWTLINYKGELGVLIQYNPRGNKFALWVLDDAREGLWSRKNFILPLLWDKTSSLYFVGMTSIGEIVMSPYYLSDLFYVYYYTPEKNTFKRVIIQGIDEELKGQRVHTFPDYIEDLTRM